MGHAFSVAVVPALFWRAACLRCNHRVLAMTEAARNAAQVEHEEWHRAEDAVLSMTSAASDERDRVATMNACERIYGR